MGARRWTSRPEVWCACGSLTVVVAPFFLRAWGLRPLSSSTRRHLDLRHGEGPLDLIWWLGHHPYPLLTDGSRPASHGRLGWPVASAFLLGGQVRRRCTLVFDSASRRTSTCPRSSSRRRNGGSSHLSDRSDLPTRCLSLGLLQRRAGRVCRGEVGQVSRRCTVLLEQRAYWGLFWGLYEELKALCFGV